jgi:hypothetical protein
VRLAVTSHAAVPSGCFQSPGSTLKEFRQQMPTSRKDAETDPVKPDAEPVKQDAEPVKPAEPIKSDAEYANLRVSVPQLLLMHNRQDRLTITLYNFRILASLGVLGFIYHDREFTYNSIVKVGISVCFILFAIGNGAGAVASQKITYEISKALNSAADYYGLTGDVLRAHTAISTLRMKFYQAGLTAIVLVVLWFPDFDHWLPKLVLLLKRMFGN